MRTVVATLLLMGSALAQADTSVRFDVPVQALADAVRAVAAQSNTNIFMDAHIQKRVEQRRSVALSGQLTLEQALQTLLQGTGLTYEFVNDNTVTVKPQSTAKIPREMALRLAEAAVVVPTAPESSKEPAQSASSKEMQDVIVTGTRLRQNSSGAGNSALPVQVYTREDLDRSGQPTINTFLSGLSEVSTSIQNTGFGVGGANRQSGVQLRGLPAGMTLVLLNGRRVEPGSISTVASVVDLDQIPMAVVDRVEILPLGSSAIYGGDALAGVVNIVLKDRMDGLSVEARHGFADGTDDSSLSAAGGHTFERGSLFVMGQLSRTSPLLSGERDFFSNGDYRPLGGPDTRTRLCGPGTVTSVSGNLPGVGASLAAIPASSSGASPTLAEFATNAGVANLCNPNGAAGGYTLVPQFKTRSLHGAGTLNLATHLNAFFEYTYNQSDVTSRQPGVSLNNVLVPASNAFNPFGVDVRVTTRLSPENLLPANFRNTTFSRAVAGLRGDIGRNWDFEVYGMSSGDLVRGTERAANVNTAARATALASSNAATALNPFAVGRAASDAVLSSIWSNNNPRSEGNRKLVAGIVRGSLFQLPAGAVQIAGGGEYLKEDLYFGYTGGALVDDRKSRAAFVEARAPLFAGMGASGKRFDRLALTLAGRIDDYSDVGQADTHQGGLEFRPKENMVLRAVGATSFRPPALLETGLPYSPYPTELFGLVDPRRGGELVVGGTTIIGANPNLKPETGSGSVLGFEWSPEWVAGLHLSVNAWDLNIKNYIIRLDPQTIINYESLFPTYVTRGPDVGGLPGTINTVLSTYVNYGKLDVSGFDGRVSQMWDTSAGTVSLAASATRTTTYNVVIAPGSPQENRLGHLNFDAWAPAWKGNLSLGLSNSLWSLSLGGRYLGSYRDAGANPRSMGNIWTLDVTGSVNLNWLARLAQAHDARLMMSVVDVTDKMPEFANTYPYFDATQGSWRGRYASARLSVNW